MDSQTCPLCLKTVAPSNYERHYRKELAALAIPQLPQQVASTTGKSDSTSQLGKRGAAIAAKSRILGESISTKETPEQVISKVKRQIDQRDKWLTSDGTSNNNNNNNNDTSINNVSSNYEQTATDFLLLQSGASSETIESTCFMCGAALSGDLVQINAHIDRCLANPEASSVLTTTASTTAATAATPSQSTDTDMTFEEYTWAGQTRVRVTSMLEGGAAALASNTGRRVEEDTNEELDIDLDDTEQYGAQQYTEDDVRRVMNEESMESTATETPMDTEALPVTTFNLASPVITDDLARANLLIASLKDRIRQQEQLISNTGKCLICMDSYKKPTTSIVCWHVYCETCWLQSLGAKKVCPQCQTITQPADLRRIYF